MIMRDPTEFRERFKRWKAGEKVYDSGYTLPAYDDGTSPDDPEETYFGKHLPDVTIEAPKVNPYVYYDGFGNAATIDSSGRRVLHDAKTFNADGFIPLQNAEDYEKARLLQHKIKDPNHAYEFGNTVRDFVGSLVTAPMFDVASEAASGILRSASDKIIKSVAKKLTKNYITSDYYHELLINRLAEELPNGDWSGAADVIIRNQLDKLNNTTIQFYKRKPFDFGLATYGKTNWGTPNPEMRIHPATTKNKYDLLETIIHELAHATDNEATTFALNDAVGILPKKSLSKADFLYAADPAEQRAFLHQFVIPMYNAHKFLNKSRITKPLYKKTKDYILTNSYGNAFLKYNLDQANYNALHKIL